MATFSPVSARLRRWQPQLGSDALVLLTALYFVLLCNRPLWRALLAERDLAQAATWGLAAAVAVIIAVLHTLILAPLCNRFTVRPVLTLAIIVAALASYYMDRFGVYLDPSMLRNVLRSDVKEARELITWALAGHLALFALLPLLLLWRVRPATRRVWASLPRRLLWWLAALAVGVAALMAVFQDLSATVRNRKELRYLITPANALWSLGVVLAQDSRTAARPRESIGTDAARAPRAAAQRPLLLVLVVGETARAANWGLNGYARQTTPELAALPELISFAKVDSCGTNTEVSLPCMFSAIGRRNYDEARIRGSEGLLQVLQRAGIAVHWRDNQSGCKGVCDGVPSQVLATDLAPGLCDGERCLDEALLLGLDELLAAGRGADQLIVMHQHGNHGPAYYRRYPPDFKRFVPACETADLRLCSREQIVNAYDNALLYTDHVLALTIAALRQRAAGFDSALIYVSDHGESLGESGLFLHGVPYAIAPEVQTRVPMAMWLSEGFAQRQRMDLACLRQRAAQPASHDHLFHTVLGLMDVTTRWREPAWDLIAPCRRP